MRKIINSFIILCMVFSMNLTTYATGIYEELVTGEEICLEIEEIYNKYGISYEFIDSDNQFFMYTRDDLDIQLVNLEKRLTL